MKYDDASWHYGGDFPLGLPDEAGATHIAVFVAWAALNGLAGQIHTDNSEENLTQLRSRHITPRTWFLRVCDEKFTDEDLNDEGNRFAGSYYGNSGGLLTKKGSYIYDYCDAFPDAASLYHVEDIWETYDILAPTIARRFTAWRSG